MTTSNDQQDILDRLGLADTIESTETLPVPYLRLGEDSDAH